MKQPYDIALSAAQKLLDAGADAAACSVSQSELREFNVDVGKFSLLRTTFDNALSLTAIKDRKRGAVAINDLSDAAIDQAVAECLIAAESAATDPAWAFADVPQDKDFCQGSPEADLDKLFLRTKELLDTVHSEYPKVSMEQMIVSHRRVRRAYHNSHGVSYRTLSGLYGVDLTFSGRDGDKSSSFNGSGAVTDSLDTPLIDLGAIRQCLADAEQQVHTVPAEGKYEGTIILTPDCLNSMLYSLLGNFVADGVLLDGTSPWKDKLGQQVVDPRLSISLLPGHPDIVCGEKYTDDGFLSEGYDVIKDGVLQNFMLSLYVANKLGARRAPNSSFSLVVAHGDTPLQDILAGVKKGLLVARFSGGSPSPSGDFSGVAKNSFLIEDGKIAGAVSETMINGNLAAMLNNLRAISKETVKDGTTVLPWLAVDGITISGK
jgi:PmbA protein